MVEDNLEEYAAALGVPLPKQRIIDYEWSDGSNYSLGVKCIFRKSGVLVTSRIELGHCVWWSPAERGGLESGIGTWVWSRARNLERLKDILRQKAIHPDAAEADEISLYDDITAADLASIDTKLDVLMEKWINLWRKVGGVKALGGKSP